MSCRFAVAMAMALLVTVGSLLPFPPAAFGVPSPIDLLSALTPREVSLRPDNATAKAAAAEVAVSLSGLLPSAVKRTFGATSARTQAR